MFLKTQIMLYNHSKISLRHTFMYEKKKVMNFQGRSYLITVNKYRMLFLVLSVGLIPFAEEFKNICLSLSICLPVCSNIFLMTLGSFISLLQQDLQQMMNHLWFKLYIFLHQTYRSQLEAASWFLCFLCELGTPLLLRTQLIHSLLLAPPESNIEQLERKLVILTWCENMCNVRFYKLNITQV